MKSLLALVFVASLATACTTAAPQFVDQSAAIVRSAADAFDRADSIAALPRRVVAPPDDQRELMRGERSMGDTRFELEDR